MDQYLVALGKRLRDLRKDADLTQEDIAGRTGVSAKYLSQVEGGHVNPSVGVLRAVAERGLKIPLSAVFSFEMKADEATSMAKEVSTLLLAQPAEHRQRVVAALRVLLAPRTSPIRVRGG